MDVFCRHCAFTWALQSAILWIHALQESEDLKTELIKGALDASRSVLSSLPHTEDVSALLRDLFEAFAVGPSQSDKHIFILLLHLTQSEHIHLGLLLHREDNVCKMTSMSASCLQLRPQHLALYFVPILVSSPSACELLLKLFHETSASVHAGGPQAAEVKPKVSKAFRKQSRGISWWLDRYTLEQPGEECELSVAGLELLRTLLPSPSQDLHESDAAAETSESGLRHEIPLQPTLLVATHEEERLLAELMQALPQTAALQSMLQDQPDSLPEAGAPECPPYLQASSSNISSSDLAEQDFMQLISTVLAPTSRAGIAGLEPLLRFPALLYEHLSLGHINCQVCELPQEC